MSYGNPLHSDFRTSYNKYKNNPFGPDTIFFTDNEFPLQKPEEIKKITLLLVGTTGVGKSTLGNFLLNNENAFVVSKRKRGTTQPEHESIYLKELGRVLHVIDTPGLDDPKDIENMKKLWGHLNDQEIHCVILCLDFSFRENNVHTLNTIRYYKEFLNPFYERKIFTVITKTTKGQIFTNQKKRRKNEEPIRDFLQSVTGLDVALIEFSNLDKDHRDSPKMALVRERILHMALQMPPTSFKNCCFPLPPNGKISQEIALQILMMKQNEIQDQLKCYPIPEHNDLVKEKEILSNLQIEFKEKSGKICSGHSYVKGDEFINFINIPEQTISVPENMIDIQLKYYVWNCSVIEKNRSIEEGMVKIHFDIILDLFTIVKKSVLENNLESRWCSYVWVEYSKSPFDEELVDLKEKISNSEKRVRDLEKIVWERERQLKQETMLDDIKRKVYLLQKDTFSKDEIEEVLEIIRTEVTRKG